MHQPSTSVTEQLMREIKHLRELIESRLDQVDARFAEQAIAVKVALSSMETAVKISDDSTAFRIDALDKLTESRFVTHRTLLDSQADKVALALAAADKAVSKAEAATERRFDSVNEFRQTLSDQAGTFVSRDQFESQRESAAERVRELAARVDRTEGKGSGITASWGYLVGAVGLFATVVALLAKFA